jgi:hypothetical protein
MMIDCNSEGRSGLRASEASPPICSITIDVSRSRSQDDIVFGVFLPGSTVDWTIELSPSIRYHDTRIRTRDLLFIAFIVVERHETSLLITGAAVYSKLPIEGSVVE